MTLKDLLDKLDRHREGNYTISLWYNNDDDTEIRTDSAILNLLGKYEIDSMDITENGMVRIALADHKDFKFGGEEW